MAKGARVQSIQQLSEFRAFLVKFAEGVRHGTSLGESEVQSTARWLKDEHPQRLLTERRKAERALQNATDDLRRKRLQPTATGDPPSTVTEQKALAKAKAKMQWLEEKLSATQRWNRQFDKEAIQFQSGLQPAQSLPEAVIPRALARLEGHLIALENYLEAQSSQASPSAPGAPETGGVSRVVSDDTDKAQDDISPANEDDTEPQAEEAV
ncbi:hypothetical protein [Algisphaera agarilytica]|uniref:Uncharacterized protein n=1 Tax=Algisphaera agarilytica TaxID=1385975 RepID=A0A7X0H318_9BACT|nr:hypothetical protein [Algisphaera agarilytica]MBB6428336.1 hypothetical protein [Algisphaera agarilytica]